MLLNTTKTAARILIAVSLWTAILEAGIYGFKYYRGVIVPQQAYEAALSTGVCQTWSFDGAGGSKPCAPDEARETARRDAALFSAFDSVFVAVPILIISSGLLVIPSVRQWLSG